MARTFYEGWEYTQALDLTADTTSETKTAVLDCADAEEVAFVMKFGDVDTAAVVTITPKENTASSTTSPTPTAVTLDDTTTSAGVITSGALVLTESSGNLDDKAVILSFNGSSLSKRYLFVSVTATVESYEIDWAGWFVKRRNHPVTQSSDCVATAYAV